MTPPAVADVLTLAAGVCLVLLAVVCGECLAVMWTRPRQ